MKKIESPPATLSLTEFLFRDQSVDFKKIGDIDWYGLANQINDEYLYWDKVKYKVPKDARDRLSPESLWQLVKIRRSLNKKNISFVDQHFHFVQTDSLLYQLHQFDLNLGGSLGGDNLIHSADKHRYLIGSVMEESIASSQIEGAVTSRVAAKEMLRKDRSPRNTSEQMIVNNYQTIRHIVENKNAPLTPESLLMIHRLMTDMTLENQEEVGQFRQDDNISVVDSIESEIIHIPPAATILPSFIQELCTFFNDETEHLFIHPIIKASIIHFMIGYFHPFTDGNGRTARALFYWYLLQKGYWLTEYLSISRVIMQSRTQYYKAFQYTEVDENDLTYFILYQVKTLTKAYTELINYIGQKNKEKQAVLALQRSENLSPRQAQIVEWMRQESTTVLSAKEVENRLGVSNQTARTDIQALIKAGYLEELSINRKERNYVRGPRLT